jgi:hypothetical protein
MRRFQTLVLLAGALSLAAVAVAAFADLRWPLERHELDNPETIKYAIEHPQPYRPSPAELETAPPPAAP